MHAVQNVTLEKVLAQNIHNNCGIGKTTFAAMVTHSIDGKMAGLGAGWHQMAAGTHAKRPDAARGRRRIKSASGVGRTFHLRGELVFGGRRQGTGAKLDAIDLILGMFNAGAHGKRFGHHGKALVKEHLVRVARRMTNGDDEMIGRKFAAVVEFDDPTRCGAAISKISKTVSKNKFCAEGLQVLAHVVGNAH